jgi:glutamate synthase (NADPH/NADH) small chain
LARESQCPAEGGIDQYLRGESAADSVTCGGSPVAGLEWDSAPVAVYVRRTRAEEVKHAREEGIQFLLLNNPVEFLGDEKGWLRAARCIKMELGPADESGRRRPVPIPGSEYEVPLDVAIIAVGTSSNPLVQSTTPDLKTRKGGYIEADPETLKTSKVGVFGAGDIVTGAATVILAMGTGRKAAAAIDEYLHTGVW